MYQVSLMILKVRKSKAFSSNYQSSYKARFDESKFMHSIILFNICITLRDLYVIKHRKLLKKLTDDSYNYPLTSWRVIRQL